MNEYNRKPQRLSQEQREALKRLLDGRASADEIPDMISYVESSVQPGQVLMPNITCNGCQSPFVQMIADKDSPHPRNGATLDYKRIRGSAICLNCGRTEERVISKDALL